MITGQLDLDPSSRLISTAPAWARTIIITTAQAPADRRAALEGLTDVIVAGQDTVDLKAAVAALAERGHRRMLAEGGPHLLAQIAEAGLLDELCLTVSPVLAGPTGSRILAGALPASSPQPLALAHVLEDDGYLFCRYTRKDSLCRTAHGPARRSVPPALRPFPPACPFSLPPASHEPLWPSLWPSPGFPLAPLAPIRIIVDRYCPRAGSNDPR